MTDRLAPAALAEDLRALADCVPFDAATREILDQAADVCDEVDRLRGLSTAHGAVGLERGHRGTVTATCSCGVQETAGNDAAARRWWEQHAVVASPISATARLGTEQRAVSEPSAAAPWTVTLAWTPDQNFGAVSAVNGRVALHAIFGLLHAGEAHEAVAAEFGLSGEEVAVLDRLRQETVLPALADDIDDGFTGDRPPAPAPAPGEPASLEALTYWVACALEVAALRVAVIEDDGTVSPLRRLVRCLRSAGLLDETGETRAFAPKVCGREGSGRVETSAGGVPTDDDLTEMLDRWVPPATMAQVRAVVRGLIGESTAPRP